MAHKRATPVRTQRDPGSSAVRQAWFDAFGLRLVQWARRSRDIWPDIVASEGPDDQKPDTTPGHRIDPAPPAVF